MDELVFLTFVVPPATPLPSPALEMNTRDAGFTLVRSVAKLLKFDACSLYFECASYFAKLNLVRTKFFVRIFAHFVKLYLSPVPGFEINGRPVVRDYQNLTLTTKSLNMVAPWTTRI